MLGRVLVAYAAIALALVQIGAAQPTTLEVVAASGRQAPGAPAGTLFGFLSRPVLNEAGEVAFRATLQLGAGGVTTSNDQGIWVRERSGGVALRARKGTPAPGAPGGGVYTLLQSAVRLDAHGRLAFEATTQATGSGSAVFGPSGATDLTLLASASPAWGSAPGVPGSRFESFERPSLNAAGDVVFLADLAAGVGGVTGADDGGMWGALGGDPLALLFREGSLAPAAAGGAHWTSWRPPSLNEVGQLSFWARLGGSGVTLTNAQTLWGPGPGGPLSLLARTDVLEPPGVNPGETPAELGAPALDDEGAIAFLGSVGLLPHGSGVETVSFAPDGAGGFELLTRQGAQAPGLAPGILLAFAASPRINAVGEVAFLAALAVGSGGVTFGDNEALCGPGADGNVTLLARKGAQAGDLPPGVLYGSFDRVDLGSQGDAAFVAQLTGGVTSADDQALFLVPRGGTAVVLLRKGQAIEVAPGDVRTLAAIEVGGADTDARDLLVNAQRQVAAIGVFTDASRAVLVAGLEPVAEVPSAAAPAALLLATLLLAWARVRLSRG